MGLNKDLRLQANEFSDVATGFFAAYLIAEIPTSKLRFQARFNFGQTDIYQYSLHLDESPSRQMAWNQCHTLGHSYCLYCGCY